MLCNRMKSSQCLFLLVALLGAVLAGCGGDEPAPAPPPPPPPPPPAFVPVDVSVELGTSGETLTLQTTESGGFTRNGEAFASGTTVEAGGNTYRLVLTDGEWGAEYVAPRPWATALGSSGDALLISRREDGLYEAGDAVFSSGGTITASNGNLYRLTLNADTNSWDVEYLPPDPTPILLGMSGETVLAERLEGGGYSVGGQRVVEGSTIMSTAGSTYRLSMQNGVWTATFVPPPPVMVPLGDSGQTVTLQVREDGQFEKDGQLYLTGSKETVGGLTYRLELQNGMWTAVPEARQIMVTLGISGQTITILAHPDGRFTNEDGQPYLSGATETVGDRTYRLVLEDGAWTAEFVRPRITVPLGASGQDLTLLIQENGTFTRTDGRPVLPNSVIQVGDDRYRLELRNGMWTASFEAPAAVEVRLGNSGESITLVAQEGGTYVRQDDGSLVRPNDLVEAGGNRYRLVFEGGEWIARYQAEPVEVQILGAGDDRIILLLQENGDYQYNDRTVEDGDTVEVGGNSYQLTFLRGSREWLAERTSGPGARTVRVTAGTQTITLTRTSTGTYTYEGNTVSNGSQITVGGERYVLTQDSAGNWSARATTAPPTVNEGTVGGPTQTDEVDTFTESRFGTNTDNPYGVRFRRRGRSTVGNRGTSMIPAGLINSTDYPNDGDGNPPSDIPDFPVYGLVGQGLVSQERTYAETAKAKLEEIIAVIQLNKPLYAAESVDPDDHIGSDGDDGLWDDAETAVARIFGLVKGDNPLGVNPAGSRVDADEVDDIIAALQDAVSSLSDAGTFADEFEDAIATKNAAPDPDTDHDADDFFTGVMSKIRFGSTTGTRFGVYAVRNKADHAAESGADITWDTGVIAYTPLDGPSADDIPSRGQARFQGDTVAIDDTASPVLYAGKIELVASFAKREVTGTVTALKDTDGNEREHMSTFSQRSEVVKSITLPKAAQTDTGFYEATVAAGTNEATLAFERNLPNMSDGDATDATPVKFEVQLLDEATEALGAWEAFGLKGSFGATRSGTVATPTLPSYSDRGDGVGDNARVVYYGTTTSADSITANEEDNTFTLTRAMLGAPPGDLGSNGDNLVYTLTSLYSTSTRTLRGQTFVAKARSEISRWISELRKSAVDTTNDGDFQTAAEAALNAIGTGFVLSWDSDEAERIRQLTNLSNGLSSRSRFDAEQQSGGLWSTLDYTDAQIDALLAARRVDFALRMDRTRYTRFGVWSQKAPDLATDSTSPTGDTIDTGTLAYSFLDRESGAGLTFTADYRGTTVAVDEDNGNLYRGTIDLIVNWSNDGTGTLTSSITDLRGVSGTSAYFQHDNKDVRTIFFSGISVVAEGTFTSSAASVDIGYRDGQQDQGVVSDGTFEGVFVGDDHGEGPLGVLGRWRIAGDIDFQGSFGADLRP